MAGSPGDRAQLSYSRLLVDLGDGAVLLVEQRRIDRAPSAQVIDGPQLLRRREVVREVLGNRRVNGPKARLRPDLLSLRGIQEVLQCVRLIEVGAGRDDRDRVLDLEGL